jgi:hypothetical protein
MRWSEAAVPPKPQTLAQCHAVIDALGLQIARERLAAPH